MPVNKSYGLDQGDVKPMFVCGPHATQVVMSYACLLLLRWMVFGEADAVLTLYLSAADRQAGDRDLTFDEGECVAEAC